MASAAQAAACAANAQFSTGPRSPEGKAVSSQNALKFGLYSQATILPGEDPAELEQLTNDFRGQFHPQGVTETRLVEEIVAGIWLERRYTRVETEIINLRFDALCEEDRQYPLGAIFAQDAEGAKVLEKIDRRRAAARRQTLQAIAELRRQQEARSLSEVMPPELPPTVSEPNSVTQIPANSVRFDRPVSAGPTPLRTPQDDCSNPARRL